jgi:hypothetical protein
MAQAKAAAKGRNVMVHGAHTAQRALEVGVLDELQIHQIPVLFGGGRRLFEVLPSRIELEIAHAWQVNLERRGSSAVPRRRRARKSGAARRALVELVPRLAPQQWKVRARSRRCPRGVWRGPFGRDAAPSARGAAFMPTLAAEGGAFLGAMYGEEEKAQKLGLVDEALLQHRQRFIRPIVDDFERWLDAVKPTLLRSEPLAAAISYYKNHRDALFRFVDDPSLAWSCCY